MTHVQYALKVRTSSFVLALLMIFLGVGALPAGATLFNGQGLVATVGGDGTRGDARRLPGNPPTNLPAGDKVRVVPPAADAAATPNVLTAPLSDSQG